MNQRTKNGQSCRSFMECPLSIFSIQFLPIEKSSSSIYVIFVNKSNIHQPFAQFTFE